MKKRLFLLSLIHVLLLLSCSTQIAYLQDEATVLAFPDYEGTSHFFLFGIGQTDIIPAKQICRDRPVKNVVTRMSFLNGLLGAITYGIYVPRDYKIYCQNNK